MTRKTGLLGGAFNPPHYGHLVPARDAMTTLGLQRVIFIPSGVHPFKGPEILAPAGNRLEMLRLALADQPGFEVWKFEVESLGISYTVDTLAEWHRLWPDEEPVLLVGGDILYELHLWKKWQQILALAHVCLLTRPGFVIDRMKAPALAWLERFWVSSGQELAVKQLGHYGFCVQPVTLLDISSTELRRRLRTGESLHSLTPHAVIEYLQRHRLYGS